MIKVSFALYALLFLSLPIALLFFYTIDPENVNIYDVSSSFAYCIALAN